jgi:tRNA threonylcarbamoyladenosine biosynthesis protein TsaE
MQVFLRKLLGGQTMAGRGAVYRFHANGPEDTEKLAQALAVFLKGGSVLALDGDLGAGKTTFSQAIARAIGVKGIVNSPTFTIIKEYEGRSLPLYHMDVYRITEHEAEELGLDEYFYGGGLTIVEWASRIETILPVERLSIYIENLGPLERSFQIIPSGILYNRWCEALKENNIIL